MRFKLYREYGALNSVPIFDAFEQGVKSLGHEIVSNNEDVTVIWSVLWSGRMTKNQHVYNECKKLNRPIIIIEVGNLKRGKTWRISIGHINNLGEFANLENLDQNRPQILGVDLRPIQESRREEILICSQHERSLQWDGMPSMKAWCEAMIKKIRQKTSRKIIVRPHPRSPVTLVVPNVLIEKPQRVPNTYDDFDINYNFHCVVNHNSGPAVQSVINGVPVVCDPSSLAGEMSSSFDNIDSPTLPNRDNWFLKLCHTEWTLKEIQQGIPLSRLIPYIQK